MPCPYCGSNDLDSGLRHAVGARREGGLTPKGTRVTRCGDCEAEWFLDDHGLPVRTDALESGDVE
jgi:hypothetical protein